MSALADMQYVDDVIPSVKEEIITSFEACLPECNGKIHVFMLQRPMIDMVH